MIFESILNNPAGKLGIFLRATVYGNSGRAELVRNVMGLANLPSAEARHIFFGVGRAASGDLIFTDLSDQDITELKSYPELIRQYLEPALAIEITCDTVKGNLVASLQIKRCDDPPYMVTVDMSRELIRGACWIREPELFRPAGRQDFDRIYGAKSSHRPPLAKNVALKLGFNDDAELREWRACLPDLNSAPSVVAARQLQNQIDVVKAVGEIDMEGSTVARLVHTQVYGSDLPYDERGINTLVENYNSIQHDYGPADELYRRETSALKLQFCVKNVSAKPLEKITVVLTFPTVAEFKVQDRLCSPSDDEISEYESDMIGYPKVKYHKSAAQVRQDIEVLAPGAECSLFENELRIALLPAIANKKIAIRYALNAAGLVEPEQGTLKLILKTPA